MCLGCILVTCLTLFCFANPARAGIATTGDVDPADPGIWDGDTTAYIGKTGNGTMDITSGSDVLDMYGYIGRSSGSTGEVTVDGAGSTWTNNSLLLVGELGSGVLNITGGGAVTVGEVTVVAHYSGSSGTIHFDNGTLTTGGFRCAADDLTGTGTINTNGLVSDVNLVFDSTYGLNQILSLNNNPAQNITVNLNVDGSGSMGAGYGGVGTMSISDGRVVESTAGSIGYQSGSIGTVTVSGTGSTWTSSMGIRVGNMGSGVLNITGGGAVNSWYSFIARVSGSTGVVTVDGVGSTWTNSDRINVGDGGSGVLNITGGGTVSSSLGIIGQETGATGQVTVDGTGSTWTNSDNLYVGNSGSGVLNITGDGAVTVGENTLVAHYSGSSGTINFDNGTLTTGGLFCSFDDLTGTGTINTHGLVSDVNLIFDSTYGLNQILSINNNPGQNITVNLNVDGSGSMGAGYSDVGTMSISDGRVIESTRGYIGYKSGATGVVTVNGAGSTWTTGSNLYVGLNGNGVLNITGGGVVSSDRGYIGRYSGSTGEVTVDGVGSTWTNNWNLVVGDGGSGVLNITGSGLVSVAGTLTIDDDEDGDDFINMATGGMLSLFDYEDASGSLLDFLGLVSGTDAIRYWDYPLGDWDDITNATLGEDYTLTYYDSGDLAGYTMLTVLEPILLEGDANNSGAVSADDYACVQSNMGNTGLAGIPGDANRDGVVSADDYASVQANFGATAGLGGVSVPEPATLSLLAIGGLVMLRRRSLQAVRRRSLQAVRPFRQAQDKRRSLQAGVVH